MADGAVSAITAVPYGRPLTGHTDTVSAVAAVPLADGRVLLASAGADGTVRGWDPQTGAAAGEPLTAHVGVVLAAAAVPLPDGRVLLASAGGDGTVRRWDPQAGAVVGRPLTGHIGAVWGLAAVPLPDGRVLLASAGIDGTVRRWNAATGDPVGEPLTGHVGAVWGLAAVPLSDGRVLLASVGGGAVRRWNAATGDPVGEPLTGHTDTVLAVAAVPLPDRRVLLASAGTDGTVRLWDPQTGDPVGEPLTGHTSEVTAVAAVPLPDRRVLLASASSDGTVRLWDPQTGDAVGGPLTGHTGVVLAVAAVPLPDGRVLLASAGADGTVRRWELVREERIRRLPGYVSDAAAAGDLLGRDREAVAIADLLTARSARPPLAVGVFGQWGEGKSQFLDLVHDAVAARSSSARDDPIAHADVRQVRFNAWHYAEADLWASLVAELFAQLGAGQDPTAEARQRSRLTSEVIAARGLRGALTGARARLEALQHARSGRLTARTVWAVVRAVPRWSWIWPVLAAGVTALVLQAGTGLGWWSGLHRWVLTLPGAAALLGLAPGLRRAWTASREKRQQIRRGWERLRASPVQARQQLDTAIAVAAGEVARLERELRDLTAAGQLAGLVQDRAGAGTYRERLGLMTQIRQDFEVMAELLVAAAPHRDSEPGGQPDGPGAGEIGSRLDAAGDALPAIDRIVLYVDDLDRCPPRRVVEVLEAVHLLLAGRLFVVVLAVDPRWLLRSISTHYRDLFDADHLPSDEAWADGPAQYLEKIFQIVLTLPPLDDVGYRRLVHSLVGVRADEQDQLTALEPDQPAGRAADQPPVTAAAGSPSAVRTDQDPSTPTAGAPAAATAEASGGGGLRTVVRVDPLALTADELRLMTLLGPPLITSPRAVKRLTNSYGVLAACRPRTADGERVELSLVPDRLDGDPPATGDARAQAYPYRAGLVLLAAVVGYPDLGPQFFTNLYRAAQANPAQAWTHWLEVQRPTPRPNPADLPGADQLRPSSKRDERLQDLIDALLHVDETADAAGLTLPRRLATWADWVIPVGRLSFPTGPAVTRLLKPPAATTTSQT